MSWTIVFVIAAAQGFFIALVLWRWKRGNPLGNRLLSVLVTLFSLSMVEYVLYWTKNLYNLPHFSNVSVNFTYLYGVLLWLYLRTIYEGKPLGRQDVWQFIPFVLASFPFIPWYFAGGVLKQQVIAHESKFWYDPLAIRLQFWGSMIHLVGYTIWNIWYVARQPKVGDTTRWARQVVAFYAVFALAYISYFVLIQFPFFNILWDYHISAVMTAMIYLIAFAGYVQPAVFEGHKWLEVQTTAKYKNSGLTPEASRSMLQHLEFCMLQEKIYQAADINLEKLAIRLNASKHHVSQVINENLGMSFFEYINQLRVEEACRLLTETTKNDLNVIEIAYAVGFSNKVSFNAAFKKSTGMTPTAYRRIHSTSVMPENHYH